MKQETTKIKLNSFVDMLAALPDDKACREYLELKIWNGTPVCSHCGTVDETHYKLKVKVNLRECINVSIAGKDLQ